MLLACSTSYEITPTHTGAPKNALDSAQSHQGGSDLHAYSTPSSFSPRQVLPGGHGAQDLSPFHGPGALKNALDSAQQSHQGGSESTKRASGDSSTITTTTTTQASVTLPPLAQIPGGVGTGTGTGGGSLREDTAASALEGVTPFRASEHEKPGRESIRHPPGVSHGGRDHPPLELLEQRGPHGGEQQKYEEGEQDNETQRGGGAEGVVVDEPLWKKVYVTSVPGLTTQVDGCDGGDSLEPLELLVKQQRPMPLVEEMAVSRCGQEGGGQDGDRDRGGGGGDGGDNDDDDNDDDGDGDDYEDDDDDDENSFHPISRRPSRSVSAVGRRASIVAREQVRPGKNRSARLAKKCSILFILEPSQPEHFLRNKTQRLSFTTRSHGSRNRKLNCPCAHTKRLLANASCRHCDNAEGVLTRHPTLPHEEFKTLSSPPLSTILMIHNLPI